MHINVRTAGLIAVALTTSLGASAIADPQNAPLTTPHEVRAAPPGTHAPEARGGGEIARADRASQRPRPFDTNIVAAARANTDFRHVLFTGDHAQVVLMSIPPGQDIGPETHARVEQIFVVVSGTGTAMMNGAPTPVSAGSMLVVTPGTPHNLSNNGTDPLRLYTIYVPPNHIDGRVHATKADAVADHADEAFGRTVR